MFENREQFEKAWNNTCIEAQQGMMLKWRYDVEKAKEIVRIAEEKLKWVTELNHNKKQ